MAHDDWEPGKVSAILATKGGEQRETVIDAGTQVVKVTRVPEGGGDPTVTFFTYAGIVRGKEYFRECEDPDGKSNGDDLRTETDVPATED